MPSVSIVVLKVRTGKSKIANKKEVQVKMVKLVERWLLRVG